QDRFLNQAIEELAEGGKVISVRLALFAEMVKTKPWTKATLKELGGMEGIGASFLEESLGARSANPVHRIHERAARGVLKALLPEEGSNIKGHFRSRYQLQLASGYIEKDRDFQELFRILDTELRLITPTDAEGDPDL